MKALIIFHIIGAICSAIPSYMMWPEHIWLSGIMLIAFGVNLVAVIDYSLKLKNSIKNPNEKFKTLTEEQRKNYHP